MDVLLQVDFNEFLTPKLCSLIVKQLIKYVMYNAQQIPYTYDGIVKQIDCMKSSSESLENSRQSMKIMKANRLYQEIKKQFSHFENTFKSVEEELFKNHGIKEIILILGTTLLCPKIAFRIQIPPLSRQEKHCDMTTRKILCILYRQITKDYDKIFSKSIGPTNTFILLRTEIKPSSDWFVPKHNFDISGKMNSIIFSFNTPMPVECHTYESSDSKTLLQGKKSLFVEEDVVIHKNANFLDVSEAEINAGQYKIVDNSTTWYQAKETIKGFKDFNIDGVSVFNIIADLSK